MTLLLVQKNWTAEMKFNPLRNLLTSNFFAFINKKENACPETWNKSNKLKLSIRERNTRDETFQMAVYYAGLFFNFYFQS